MAADGFQRRRRELCVIVAAPKSEWGTRVDGGSSASSAATRCSVTTVASPTAAAMAAQREQPPDWDSLRPLCRGAPPRLHPVLLLGASCLLDESAGNGLDGMGVAGWTATSTRKSGPRCCSLGGLKRTSCQWWWRIEEEMEVPLDALHLHLFGDCELCQVRHGN
ncbi:hypothetical protein E2562_027299 [Oryza meyeriana var. granulata]|uniref:Uncharacterized protein n=1 Tax=Oryza meyeriana var. granulata TaxID=110450 RepID=A0A6G1C1U5_9ORYZ|nr:hypothetical protein E2562_027299 [Oryza meyeriana var. granulata]